VQTSGKPEVCAIHVLFPTKDVDARVKPAHDVLLHR
jgi:hypothetical protein